jgi:nicotinamide-nucleotide amidase
VSERRNRAAILLVGTELTDGIVQDVHGRHLAGVLKSLGFAVKRIVLVPDDEDVFRQELDALSRAADLIMVTGGLGPTSDDVTREVVAQVCGVQLQFRPEVWEDLTQRFSSRMSATNRKQAYIPAGFQVLHNAVGTAPGFAGTCNDAVLMALPGPPRELSPMLDDVVLGTLRDQFGLEVEAELVACVFLTPESRLEQALQEARAGDVRWSTRVEGYRIVFTLRGGSEHDREATLDGVAESLGAFRVRRGDHECQELAFRALQSQGETLACAESCTGGLVAKLVTDVPGSSQVFRAGYVTYANEAKERLLGVRVETLEKHGAVSRETVLEMAAGAQRSTDATVSVAVSGVAGPSGGSPDKPVGTVWIAVRRREESRARGFHFSGDRDRVRRRSAVAALLLVECLVLHPDRLDSIGDAHYI